MPRQSPATIFETIRISPPVLPISRLVGRKFVDVFIVADAIEVAFESGGGYYSKTVVPRDPSLDLTFNCYGTDRFGNRDQGVIGLTTSILGAWLNQIFVASPIAITTSILGTFAKTVFITSSPIVLTTDLTTASFVFSGTSHVPFASGVKSNWVKWSNIGSLDFTIGKDNVAGERPLDWKGDVYAIKKLGTKAVAYGENGVSFLIPAGTTYGLNTIYRVGLKSKNAVAGDDTKHFFIDKAGQLWKVGEALEKLDYSEYLSPMNNNLVMSYDNLNNLVYICDGSIGYVYNPATLSLGRCQPNITGIGSQGGLLYVTSPSVIVADPFEICTDIYDLGSRNSKTVHSLEFGIDLTTTLQAAIDYRRDKDASFFQTPWYNVSKSGNVFITAFGREFKFRAKTLTYEWFSIDYLKISGVTHAN